MDGWISLGDCGRLDEDGHLYILDRQEDIITTRNDEAYLSENSRKQIESKSIYPGSCVFW